MAGRITQSWELRVDRYVASASGREFGLVMEQVLVSELVLEVDTDKEDQGLELSPHACWYLPKDPIHLQTELIERRGGLPELWVWLDDENRWALSDLVGVPPSTEAGAVGRGRTEDEPIRSVVLAHDPRAEDAGEGVALVSSLFPRAGGERLVIPVDPIEMAETDDFDWGTHDTRLETGYDDDWDGEE